MNLAEILKVRAEIAPQQMALIQLKGLKPLTCSFAELDAASCRAASLMMELGLNQGDAVLVILPVSIELYVVLLALFRLGLVAVFPAPSVELASLNQCCARSKPKGFVGTFSAHCLQLLSCELQRIPVKISVGTPFPGSTSLKMSAKLVALEQIANLEADDSALITFTSGSTGEPKGAVRSHGFLLAQHDVLSKAISLKAGELDLVTLPVFVLSNLAAGVTSLIPDVDLRRPGEINADAVLRQIDIFQPTRCTASPAFFQRLADACLKKGRQMPSFEKIYTGGAPVFPDLLDKIVKVAPQANVVCVYGSTEAEPIAHIDYKDISTEDRNAIASGQGLPLGYPVPEIQLHILRNRWGTPIGSLTAEVFRQEFLPSNAIGEIVVSGNHVLSGYLDGKGNSETKLSVDGRSWHRTGDAGYIDNRGLLWFVGRCVGRIHDQWGDLYPITVESACRQFAGIRNSAVASHCGKRLLLLEKTTEAQLDMAAIAEKLAWAHIDTIRCISRLPLDHRHNAKIDYVALNKLLDRIAIKNP